jgi:hypothetical protein
MYKNILFSLLFFCATSFTANAQNDVSTDPLLIEIFTNYDSEISRVRDIDKIKEYLADNVLTENEISNLYVFMGYKTHAEMLSFISEQNNKLSILSKKYNLGRYTTEQLKSQFESGYKSHNTSNAVDECRAENINCIASVTAQAVVMHLGCAGLDLTVIAGIICHGSAFVYQHTASNNCNIAYRRCKGLTVQ